MKTLPHFNHLFGKSTLAILALLVLSLVPSHAVNYTWINNGTDWNTPANWSPSSGIPNAGGDVVIFNTAAIIQPNISSSVLVSRITANSASATGYILSSSEGVALTLGTTSTGTSSSINYQPNSGSLTISAQLILGAANATTQTFNVVNAGGTINISGSISSTNTVQLQKTGPGKLVLSSATNSYSGGTLISGGTLVLNGTGTLGTGNLTLAGGVFDISELSGSTYSHASALVGAGSILGGGKTLSVNGLAVSGTLLAENITLSLAGISSFSFTDPNFSGGSFDSVTGSIGGTEAVNFGGTLSLNFSGGSYSYGSSVQIFDVDSYSGSFSEVSFSGLDAGQSAIFDASTGTVTVIPEPSVWSLCALGALLLAAKRRRNLHKA